MRLLVTLFIGAILCTSCATPKTGCPSNGKNVDAKKLAEGDPATIKLWKKAPKFKMNKF